MSDLIERLECFDWACPNAEKTAKEAASEIARLREALAWYGEQTRLCRLIHREGDEGRDNLSNDGGQRARAALEQKP